MFDFNLEEEVTIKGTLLQGMIDGRAEFMEESQLYRIRYIDANGNPCLEWFTASRLDKIISEFSE